MKGLLRKELYTVWAYYKVFVVVVIAFICIGPCNRGSLFLMYYPMLFVGMIPMSLLAYDENSKWLAYSAALPCTRRQIVSAKYLLLLILVAAVTLLTVIAQSAYAALHIDAVRLSPSLLCTILALGLLAPSLVLPIEFKFGVEKGRLVYYAEIGRAHV